MVLLLPGFAKRASCRYKLYTAVVALTMFIILWNRTHLQKNEVETPSVLHYIRPATSSDRAKINNSLDIRFVEENILTLDQTDPQLIQYTRIRHLTPPSKLPYNLNKTSVNPYGFSSWVAKFFRNKRNGIFIEAGANDGERTSHTLYLEREFEWTGLLIECNPLIVPYLKTKHRKAWVADVCLSTTHTPRTLNFSNPVSWPDSGSVGKPGKIPFPTDWTYFDVQTIPLYTVLAALGIKEVDYFSFDIEGQELNVLRNFPFDLFLFKLLIVEVAFYNATEKSELNQLLTSNGYVFVTYMDYDNVYVHKKFQNMIPNSNPSKLLMSIF